MLFSFILPWLHSIEEFNFNKKAGYGFAKVNHTIFWIVGLPEDFHNKDYKVSSDPPCIIEKLCSLHYGLVLEAKGIKEHFWKPYIRKLFDKKVGQ